MVPEWAYKSDDPLPFPEIRAACRWCRGEGCLICDAERARRKEQAAIRSAKAPEEIGPPRRRLASAAQGRIVMPDLRQEQETRHP